jgi:arginine repressor
MAKEISKSQAVRDYLTAHPEATTAEVVAAMKKQGIDISSPSVHTIKWSLKKSNWPAAKAAAKTPAAKEAAKAEPHPAAAEPVAEAAKPSKTQAVKDYLAAHPKAGPTEISTELMAQGIDVSTNYVSNIKFQMGLKKNRRKAKAAAPAAAAVQQPAAEDQISLAALIEAKKLIEKLGGVDVAKKAIMALAQLAK